MDDKGVDWQYLVTRLNVFFRYPEEQTSISIRLGGAKSYYLQVTGAQSGNADCMSIGVQFPDGKFSRPIAGGFISYSKLGILKNLCIRMSMKNKP